MCGIIGVISNNGAQVFRDLANGAHFLQHRGPAYAGLFTFDVKPIASFVIKPGEGLSPQVEKVADSLKPVGACSLCGTSIRVTLGYAGAGVPAGATITSADVALSCAY